MTQPKSVNYHSQLIELGCRIKALRKQKNFSQESLALDSGIDYSYLGRIERGENNPTYLILCAIAKTLCVNLKELI
jgi:transcriptional regulator with XRE-family HTH domain